MSFITATRDELRDLINNAHLSGAPTAASAYSTLLGLETLSGGRLLVVPREVDSELSTHDGLAEDTCTIDVALQVRGADLTPATLDPWVALAEAIKDAVIGQELASGMTCLAVRWPNGTFAIDTIDSLQTFTCILACEFKGEE